MSFLKSLSLDELSEIIAQSIGVSDEESEFGAPIPIVLQLDIELSTIAVVIHRFFRATKPPKQYSPIENYIILTNGGELQSYEKPYEKRIRVTE